MSTSSTLRVNAPGVRRQGNHARYRVMVVDDSAVIRGFISRLLESDPEFEVVATAVNGEQAVKAVARCNADVVILDIEMPVMDGLTALPQILKARPGVKVLMASTLTRRNAAISIKALAAGASDYVPKPISAREVHGSADFRRDLFGKIRALAGHGEAAVSGTATARARTLASTAGPAKYVLRKPSAFRPEVLAIGCSTGGPKALFAIFESLKATVNFPIFITQHMPATFTTILAEHIARISGAPCAEGRDKERVEQNRVYLAPGDHHMIIERDADGPVIRLSTAPPENYCRPAVDPMFRSIADTYGARVLSVVLTGMGQDGLDGARAIIDAGGTLVAQDEASSVVWGMPGAVTNAGLCSATLSLHEVAPFISSKLKR